jgi:hypothetical protein
LAHIAEPALPHPHLWRDQAIDLDRLIFWCNEPPPILAFAQQGGKASNLGQHSQSIEPLRPTGAAVLQSPIIA